MQRTLRHILFACAFVFLFSLLAGNLFAGEPHWSGTVISVLEGDLIEVGRDDRTERVRLADIDCPEKQQLFSGNAAQFTRERCLGKVVTIRPVTTDRKGRIIARVILPNGRDLGEELVKAGLAWYFKKMPLDARLASLEKEAKAAKRGLWSEPDPIPPWLWRARRRRGPL